MKLDSQTLENLSVQYQALASRSISFKNPTLNERQFRISKEIMDISTYLKNSVSVIETTEKKQILFQPGKSHFTTYTNLNLVSQLTKKSRYSYGSLNYNWAFKEWNQNYTRKYFHIGANASICEYIGYKF